MCSDSWSVEVGRYWDLRICWLCHSEGTGRFGLPDGIPGVPDQDKLSTREDYYELVQRSFEWYRDSGELSLACHYLITSRSVAHE